MPEIKEVKHTPGPWEACGKAVHAETGREIVFGGHNTRSGSDEEQRANARLIAAAPELLEALKVAVSQASWTGITQAHAAIAKAEGVE